MKGAAVGYLFFVVVAVLGIVVNADCSSFQSCGACTTQWNCVWCNHAGNSSGACLNGTVIDSGGCSIDAWQWRQCSFPGWVLIVLVGGGAALILLVTLVVCCCCCCKCCGRKRKTQYEPLTSFTSERNVDYSVSDKHRAEMHAKYGQYGVAAKGNRNTGGSTSFSESPDFQ